MYGIKRLSGNLFPYLTLEFLPLGLLMQGGFCCHMVIKPPLNRIRLQTIAHMPFLEPSLGLEATHSLIKAH